MWQFIKLLLTGWFSKVLLLLGVVSAGAIYIPRFTLPVWIPSAILVVAVFVASYDVYKKQQREIEELRSSKSESRAKLVIHSYEGSRYIVNVDSGPGKRIMGMLVELSIAIENKGLRHSSIVRCDLVVSETGKSYANIKPRFLGGIQGRKVSYGLDQRRYLMTQGVIAVEPTKMIPAGILPFYVKEVPGQDCSRIHCTLTLTDTEENSATHEFELPEK